VTKRLRERGRSSFTKASEDEVKGEITGRYFYRVLAKSVKLLPLRPDFLETDYDLHS